MFYLYSLIAWFMNTGISILKQEEGVTAIEYAMIAGLIAAVIVGAVTSLGTHLNLAYNSVTNF